MLHQLDATWYDEFIAELEQTFAYVGPEREKRVRMAYAHDHARDIAGKIHAVATMTTAPIQALRDENPTWDILPTLARYDRPLMLAMAAPNEGVLDAARYAELHRALVPAIRYVEFPGAGHSLHRGSFGEFTAALNVFLEAT